VETRERRNEKAIKQIMPLREIPGISIHFELKPEKAKFIILKPGTTKVTRYKATAEEIHLKKPKVKRLIGKSSRLMIGFATTVAIVKPIPARRTDSSPFSKYKPDTALEIKYKLKVSTI
jgi:hypothetical protein